MSETQLRSIWIRLEDWKDPMHQHWEDSPEPFIKVHKRYPDLGLPVEFIRRDLIQLTPLVINSLGVLKYKLKAEADELGPDHEVAQAHLKSIACIERILELGDTQ